MRRRRARAPPPRSRGSALGRFRWAPPGVLVDAIGAGRMIVLLERARRPVPSSILDAAVHLRPVFDEPAVDRARFFVAA